MSFCVFIHRSDSIYDDLPAEQYQFPRQYLRSAESCVGDWIVYLEPSKVPNSRGYFAIARVQTIVSDPKAPEMYLALIESGSYLEFARPVPFRHDDGPIERGLLNENNKLSGRSQAAIRRISAEDFDRIIEFGLADDASPLPRIDSHPTVHNFVAETEQQLLEPHRPRVTQLTTRTVRDRVFRRIVLRAYDERCAITGLKFINGSGRAEVDAAHIRPVELGGPDVVGNGLALSGTAHWMFDRGLVSLSDNLEILISRQVNDLDGVRLFVNKSGRATQPQRSVDRPHPRYLAWHRENCFKQ